MARSGKRSKRRSTTPDDIASVSMVDLRAEVARRSRLLNGLQRRRLACLDRVRALEAEIAALGGIAGSHKGRTRPRNAKPLLAALEDALKGTTMSVTEVSLAVQRAGYITTSPSFRTIVNQTLINSGRFRRVGRGRYTAKATK